ncbi:MAG: hypothetical protein ACQERZ_03420 [Fusobacteriota bacterium]
MKEAYKKGMEYILKNKLIIILGVIIGLFNAPLKSNIFTGLGGYFLSLFSIIGFIGMASDRQKRVGFRLWFRKGIRYFTKVIITLSEFLMIYLVNLFLVLFFTILPIILIGGQTSVKDSIFVVIILSIIVGIYRLPLYVFSFLIPIYNKKESGKYAMVKAKKILWENISFWKMVLPQFSIYFILLFLKTLKIKDPILYTSVDIVLGLFILFCFIVDYFWLDIKIKQNDNYKIIYTNENTNTTYTKLIGRFIM